MSFSSMHPLTPGQVTRFGLRSQEPARHSLEVTAVQIGDKRGSFEVAALVHGAGAVAVRGEPEEGGYVAFSASLDGEDFAQGGAGLLENYAFVAADGGSTVFAATLESQGPRGVAFTALLLAARAACDRA